MPILDNRTLITNADALDPAGAGIWEDDAGNNMNPNLSTTGSGAETWIEGTAAISERVSGVGNLTGLLFNTETTNNWTGNTFYIWANMNQTGVLDIQSNGGFCVRFTGPTVTNWFEVYVAGSDTYGGGWQMFVVDVDVAAANAAAGILGGTNGTPPLTSAIDRVGCAFRSTANAPGALDNLAVDAIWRLPADTPGVVVEGVNTALGSPGIPFTIADILAAGDNGDTTKAWGVIDFLKNGTYSINTPIEVGTAAGSPADAAFLDTNEVIGWENQLVPNGFYGFSAVSGASGNVTMQFGEKTGTGVDATGSQGFVITTGGPRWFMNYTDTDVLSIGLYGCSFLGTSNLELDNTALEAISTLYIDGIKATVSGSTQLRVSAVNPNVGGSPLVGSPIDAGFFYTNDISNIKYSNLQFTQGHGIVITPQTGSPPVTGSPIVPSTQTSLNNTYVGYGPNNSSSAAVWNADGKFITLNSTGDTGLTVRTTANLDVVADPVTTLITVLNATTQLPVQDARVWVNDDGSPITTYLFGTGGTLTDALGQVSDSRVLGASLDVEGRVRRATRTLGSPLNETFYKTGIISGTIDNVSGLSVTVFLIPDE